MTGVKKNAVVFFGLFLVGMLFVPTGIPFMDPIPEAEAAVSASHISIGQSGTTNGGDCSTVGTWQPQPNSSFPNGGICTLTTDIQITGTGIGISIASSSVTLDGAGHTVTGTQTSGYDHMGLTTCNQCHTMVVKNLTIENFSWGLRSYNANGLTITGVTVENVGSVGMYINGVDSLLLENNIVNDSGMQVFGKNSSIGVGDGTCTGTGQYVSAGSATNAPIVIKNNQVSGGLYTSDGAGWCIDGNTVTNGSLGVAYAWDQVSPQNHIIKNNQVTGNTNGNGFDVSGSGNTFDSNTASGNRNGFNFDYRSQNNIITNNVANNNGDYGFYFSINLENVYEYGDSVPGSVGHTFTGNTASGNGVADIEGITQESDAPSGTVTISSQISLLACDPANVTDDGIGNLICGIPDPTGGDCTQIGTWNVSTKTCTLTADVIVTSSGNGIYVGQNQEISTLGITIDGAGHTITGPGTAYGNYGVWLGQTAQITVKNLFIENFYNGIRTPYANGITITGNTISNTGSYGISITSAGMSTGLLVSDNTIQNGQNGIEVQSFMGNESCSGDHASAPAYWYWNSGNTPYEPYPVIVKDNTITGISQWGVNITTEKACVDGNTITGAGSGMNISGNSLTYPSEGVSNDNNIVSNNIVTSSTNDGIRILGDNNIIDSNTSNGAQYYSGFSIDNRAQNNIITNNIANNNAQYGFEFEHDDATADSHAGHTFTGNTASGNSLGDIVTTTWVSGNMVWLHDGISGSAPELTITSFETYEEGGHIKFDVEGDVLNPTSMFDLTHVITDSNGNVVYNYPSQTTTSGTSFGLNGPMFWTVTAWNQNGEATAGEYTTEYSGDFTLTICTPENNCVTQNFTVTVAGQSGPPSGTVTISSPIEIYAFDGSFNPSPTGGDCTQIGTWNESTKTCTLTADIVTSGNIGAIKVLMSFWQSGFTGEGTTESITIDGAGHTITGASDNTQIAVAIQNTAFTTVKNLVIENFYQGINSAGTSGLTITGNTIKNAHAGMSIGESGTCPNCGSGLVITDNTIDNSGSNTGSSSIYVGGFEGDGTCNTTIPYFLDLREIGQPPPGNNPTPVTIKGNTITDGDGAGINIDTAGACVDSNTITGTQTGIHISGPGYSPVPYIFGAMGETQSNYNIISNNAVTDSTNDGIDVVGSGNTFDSNTSNGAQYGSGFDFDWRSRNNVITDNVADNNAKYGFYFGLPNDGMLDGSVAPGSIGHTFVDNTASGNGVADIKGITILPTGPYTISDNATGGDCAEIGIWNSGSKTCTLTTDIVGSPTVTQISIYDSGITLDGNGHTISSTYDATGVDPSCHVLNACSGGFLNVVSGNLYSGVQFHGNNNIVKNITVKGFGNGVTLGSSGNTLKNSMLDGNYHGFYIGGSNNLATENTIQNSLAESFTIFSSNNQIYNNNFIDDYKKGVSYAANNVYNQEDPYGGNYYEHIGYSIPSSYGATYGSGVYPAGHCQPSQVVDGALCPSQGMIFSSMNGNMDHRPWITKDGWVNFVPPSFTGPTVTPPSDITVSATLTSGTTVVYPPATATDNIAVTSGPTCDPASGTLFPVGTTTVTCTASDGHGNAGEATFTITITFTDVTPPTITVPADMSVSSISESGAAVTFDVTAADDVAVTTGPTCDPASGSTFPIGTTTVTCTASDAAGLTITDSFTVTLEYHPLDNTAPIITGLDDITLTTSNAAGAIVTFTFSATDNVAVTTGPTCGVTSGSNFPVGDTIVTCTASDDAENTATETFTVTVNLVPPPSINIQFAPTFFVDTGVFSAPVYYPQPTAASALGIASGPTCTPSSNSQFSVGSTLVTCTATDAIGTVGTSTFLVTVLQQSALSNEDCIDLAGSGHDEDSVFVCEFPFNVTVEENKRLVWVDRQPWQGFYRHSITSSAGLFDHSDAGVMDMLPSAWGGVGTYSFYDKVNTSLTGSITIAESDTTDPTVTVPSDMTVSTDTPTGTPTITYSVSASDDREVTTGPTCTPASGSNFSVGTTTVSCSASDAAGNEGTSSFTVTVEYTFVDETPPGLVPPSGISLFTTNPTGTIVTYTGVTATDNVAVTSGPTCDPVSGTMFPIGITEVTCTAYDEAGNEGSTSFTVTITQTILDSSAPAITTSNNISQSTTSSAGKIVNYQVPTAVDNVGVTIGPTCTPASGYLFSVGITTVTCSASDAAGNTATATFTVTIVNTAAVGDNIPPTLSQPGNIVQDMNLSNGAIVAYNIPTATDDKAVTYGPTCTPYSGSLFSIGTTTVTCIAKDAAGNQGSVSFSVIVTQPIAGEENTLTLQLDKSSYFSGDLINITGVATGDTVDVLLAVSAPNGDIISIDQIAPESTMSQSSSGSVTILNTVGSSFEGCEPNCFLPRTVTIDAGETVIWENPDNFPHTVTSGTPVSGPNDVFDSGLMMAGGSFSFTFNASGTYDYFCEVHPWMQGSVSVSGSQTTSTPSEGSSSFATEILTIGPLWSQDGTYTVKANYGPATATKTFNFTVVPLDAIPFTSVPSNIALSINKSAYTGDETISINVALIGGSVSQPISIEVNDPVGIALFLQTLNTDSQARVSSQFTLPENVVSGTYTVSASSTGELWDLADSVAFTGIPLEPGILDSSISVTNEQGEAVTTYNAGELGYFSTKMTTKSTSQILVTVSVLDAQQNTLGVGFFKTVLPKGDAEIVLGFEIPEGTISGDAQVFTNFFTDWPDQGGIPIGEEVSSKVNIIGVEPVEEVAEVLEEPVQMQVTVQNAPGSSFEGCEETNSCFLPNTVTIDVGGTVTWENPDDFPHTVTSGTSSDGPDGHFDSDLIAVGESFSNTFDEAGTYNYFCMIHPWMQGSVVVGGSDTVVEPVIEPEPVEEEVVEEIEEEPMPESSGMQATVQNAPGSSFEGCEPNCFLPSTVIIDLGGTVTWENPDDFPHTMTSGTSANGPDGHFDSSLIMAGDSFSHTFDTAGTYDYFCMVHPWMQGSVVVGGSETVVEPIIEQEPESSGMQATVQNAPGSATPGCEETNSCFLPSIVTINLGGTITWENPDNAGHTTTSRVVSQQGAGGIIGLEWDSGFMTKGQSFSHTFDTEGTYDYFCLVHPWMQGTVVVQAEEEEPPPSVQEEVIEVVNILALNGTSNIILLTGTEYLEVDKSSLNDEHEKLTVSSWVKPDFISTAAPQYSAVSKEGSFELFLTNTKDPEHSPGFSVFDGQIWNTVLVDSKVTDGWHHLAGVVNGKDLSLYLDSVLIGTESMPSQSNFNEQGQLVPQTAYMAASENAITVGVLINSVSLPIEILHSYQGLISDVNIITDALTNEQVSNLYIIEKDMFQRDFIEAESVINGTVTTTLVTTESPELSASECIDLAKERGLYDIGGSEAYTLVCQFPFDVIIPINSRLLWMETLSLENAPYHSIQSVDNLFGTGSMVSADMGFYDNTFTDGVYEYYDGFDESLTGKIIISKPINSVNINVGSASPECADTYSCYDTFAAQVDVGEKVTWQNQDTLYHTVTSGTPGDGPDGLFDSGLIDTYLYFSYTFEEAGTYDYFCMVHPWKQGMVVVGEA